MQHSIKDLWLYPFPEIDVVHTQERKRKLTAVCSH